MTSLEFAQYLAAQPWGAEYYQNLFNTSHYDVPIPKGGIINGAFKWIKTGNLVFWKDLSDSLDIYVDDTWLNLCATLTDYFTTHHPEFLI